MQPVFDRSARELAMDRWRNGEYVLGNGSRTADVTGGMRDLQPTVRANSSLRQILGEFQTLTDGLDYAAGGQTGMNFYSARGQLEHVVPYADLRERALMMARRLLGAGIRPGDRVAIVAETTPDFVVTFFGCQYAGMIPCPMPYSMYIGGRDAYVDRVKGMLQSASASAAICSGDLIGQVGEAGQALGLKTILTHDELGRVEPSDAELSPFGPDDMAYIQYSSGSTSHPKGVLITQRAITHNARGILQHGLRIQRDDRAMSWLPLYHDMGLVGFCLTPMMGQVTMDYMATTAFARRPLLWLKIISDNQCTITYSPSFGYDLAARRAKDEATQFDLSAVRIAGIGGDMVRPDVLERFAATFGPSGFSGRAFLPSYGMAESTLGVAFAPLGTPISVDRIDRVQSKLSRKAVPAAGAVEADPDRARSFVVCGRPLPGHEIEVRGDDGETLAEREIGHIVIKGPSLMAGYYDNPEATAAIMSEDGWMATGDMGYMLDGQIVITGRSKDLILHNGRNIWPQDIEWAVEQIAPLRSGDAAAFAVEGDADDESVVVLVQCRLGDEGKRDDLRRNIAAVVHQQAGVECRVVLVPPRSLPFTSSGKLSRAGAKLRYLSGEIAEVSKQYVARTLRLPSVGLVQGAAD